MRYSVDRIEEGFAELVGEDGEALSVPVDSLGFAPSPGMILEPARGGGFVPRPEAAETARERANALLGSLLDKSGKQ